MGDLRYTWAERFVLNPVILLVNGDVQFYRDDKGWFIVVDAKRRIHRFSLIGIAKLSEQTK